MDHHQSTQSTSSGCGSEKSLTQKTMAAAKCQRRPKFPGNGNSSYKDLWEDRQNKDNNTNTKANTHTIFLGTKSSPIWKEK